MTRYIVRCAAFTALLSATLDPSARAATINNISSFSLPGFSTGALAVAPLAAPNNDNSAAASPNVISYSILFNSGGVGPADLEFNLTDSGGTTEYRVTPFGFGVIKNTGHVLIGFRAELGFGVGGDFVASPANDGLDFDLPEADPIPTSVAFPVLRHDLDSLRWTGAAVGLGQIGATFAVDVPDALANVHPLGLNRFTLRLTPVAVPEPSSAVLVIAGLAMCAWRRRSAPGV